MKSDFFTKKDKKLKDKAKNTIKYVDVSSITHINCVGYTTTVYTIDANPIIVSGRLAYFESNLEKFMFVRVNRSSLVNMALIRRYIGSSRVLELINGVTIKVSRRRVYKLKTSSCNGFSKA